MGRTVFRPTKSELNFAKQRLACINRLATVGGTIVVRKLQVQSYYHAITKYRFQTTYEELKHPKNEQPGD